MRREGIRLLCTSIPFQKEGLPEELGASEHSEGIQAQRMLTVLLFASGLSLVISWHNQAETIQ